MTLPNQKDFPVYRVYYRILQDDVQIPWFRSSAVLIATPNNLLECNAHHHLSSGNIPGICQADSGSPELGNHSRPTWPAAKDPNPGSRTHHVSRCKRTSCGSYRFVIVVGHPVCTVCVGVAWAWPMVCSWTLVFLHMPRVHRGRYGVLRIIRIILGYVQCTEDKYKIVLRWGNAKGCLW